MTAVRILLVEDEGIIRLATSEVLKDAGFEVVEAWNGDEAVRLLNGHESFDILFTDVRMPGTFDGIDVAMHARSRYPAIPILIVSGYAAQLGSRLGAVGPPVLFIGKPYGFQKIVGALRRLCTFP